MAQTQSPAVASLLALAGTTISNTYSFRPDRKTGTKREPVTVKLPVPTAQEISVLLSKEQENNPEAEKVRELVLNAVHAIVIGAAKGIVDDNTAFQPEDIVKFHKEIGLNYIANLPRAQRGGVTNQALQDFAMFFSETAVERMGITEAAAANLSRVFGERKDHPKYFGNAETRPIIMARLEAFAATMSDEEVEEHNQALTHLTNLATELDQPMLKADQL